MFKSVKISKVVFSMALIVIILGVGSLHAYAKDYAYSIGTDYDGGIEWWWEDGVNTSQSAKDAATDFGLAGYTSYYNIKPTYTYLTGDSPAGKPRMESRILFFAGHANNELMVWNYHNKNGDYKCGVYYEDGFISEDTNYKYVGLNDYDLIPTRLVVFAGCSTGSGSSNLLRQAVKRGATAAVGFKEKVGTSSATKWRGHFTDALGSGHSVSSAISIADSFDYDDDSVLSSTYIGNGTLVIKLSTSNSLLSTESTSLDNSEVLVKLPASNNNNEELEELEELPVSDDIKFDFKDKDYTDIVNYISKVSDNFNKEDYIVKVIDKNNNDGLITFKYAIDGIETNFKYTAIIEDNKLTTIYLNGTISQSQIDNLKTSLRISERLNSTITNELKEKAIANDIKEVVDLENHNYNVINQVIKEKIDIDKKEKYNVVITHYEDKSTGTYFATEQIF